MNRRALQSLAAACLLVFPFCAALSASVEHEGRVLWVNAHHSLFKIWPLDGTPTLELTALPQIQALAVDQVNDHVWIYSHKRLWAYDAHGNELVAVDMPRNFHGDAPGGMVVDEPVGNVWIGIHRKLYRLGLNGSLQATLDLDRDTQGLALDNTRSRLWVVEDRSLVVLDKAGNTVLTVYISRPDLPTAIAYDAFLDQVWVAFARGLYRYDQNGNQVFGMQLPDKADLGDSLAVDGVGGLWMAGDRMLAHLDQNGVLQFTLKPFASDPDQPGKIVGLAADPLNHTAWVASSRYLKQYQTDSTLLQTVESRAWYGGASHSDGHDDGEGNGIEHVTLYVGTIAPTLAFAAPKSGSYTSHVQPSFTLAWEARGSGVDPATLKLTSGGTPFAVDCQTSDTSAQCMTVSSLSDGTYTLSATVADFAGNVSKPASVTFTIDTAPPPLPLATGIGFLVDPSGSIVLMGETGSVVLDVATITITNIRTGQTVTGTVNSDGSFSIPVPGTSNDEFAITLTDLAGNVTTPFYMHGGDPMMQLVITSPAAGAVIAGDIINVTGSFQGPLNTGITVNGSPAIIEGSQWIANNVSLSAGANTLTVTATTSGRLAVTQTVNVTSAGSSPLLLNATPEAAGAVPLAVTFQYQFSGQTTPQSLKIDYTGSGNYVTVSDPTSTLSYAYANPGIYPVILILTDSNNVQYRAQVLVVVQDADRMDTLFKSIWQDITTALISGNKAVAMNALDGTAQRNYGPVFDVLIPHMNEIVSSFSPLLRSSVSNSIGEYAIARPVNGQENVFFIYFIKDQSGIWRLDSM